MSGIDTLIKTNKTAFYTFDTGELKKRVGYLRAHLPEGVSLCYAVKANTFIIKELIGSVDCFEICSPGEAEICRELGVPAGQMVISGVYKSAETVEALAADPDFSGTVTAESPLPSPAKISCLNGQPPSRTLPQPTRVMPSRFHSQLS